MTIWKLISIVIYKNKKKKVDYNNNMEFEDKKVEFDYETLPVSVKSDGKDKYWKKYRNSDKGKRTRKQYSENNKEKIKKYQKEYRENNKDKSIEYQKNENRQQYLQDYRDKTKETRKEYDRIRWIEKSKSETYKSYKKEYDKTNRDKLNEYNRSYMPNYKKNRKSTDPIYRIRILISDLIRNSIKSKGYVKKSKAFDILGCSFEEFKIYIESKFETWMNWDNHGLYNGQINYGWDLDHIIPISTAKSEDEILKLNHYTNFQPLCSFTNRYIKSNKTLCHL